MSGRKSTMSPLMTVDEVFGFVLRLRVLETIGFRSI